MLMLRAGRRLLLTLIALSLVCDTLRAAPAAPVAELAPDARPTLLLVTPPPELLLVHHAHPMPTNEAEQLALRLGLFIAGPIIRRRARESAAPLPRAWRSASADRGFAQQLTAALERTQTNWPWRTLRVVGSREQADELAEHLQGEDVAIASFELQLEDLEHEVQFSADARILLVRSAGTPRESRTQILLRHLAVPLPADAGQPARYAALFSVGGALDQQVSAAVSDLTHGLAVIIGRLATPTPTGPLPSRRFEDLAAKPHCPECRPEDAVLHEEPGRVWVAPGRLPGTVLSLPR
ncbi:MAG TPA: hypothetical protein VME21_00500 [Steroidobacteraceae bacterium]|nr:hypothetical protein [Steroidobacteraceae bacterium]